MANDRSYDSDDGFDFLAITERLFQSLDLIDHLVVIVGKLKKVNRKLKSRHRRQNCSKNCRYELSELFDSYVSLLKDMTDLVSQKLNNQSLYLNIDNWFDTLCELTQNIQTLEVNTIFNAESHISVFELKRLF